jgi:hypothetical protein
MSAPHACVGTPAASAERRNETLIIKPPAAEADAIIN